MDLEFLTDLKRMLLSKLFLSQNMPQGIITEEEVQYGQLKIITLIASLL